MTVADTANDIAAALASGRFSLHDEKACQGEIEEWLKARLPGVDILREQRLSPGEIPDFMIAGVAVEVKMNAARPASILRQLERYAEHEAVLAIVLATNRAVFLRPTVRGKPLVVVSLGRAWL